MSFYTSVANFVIFRNKVENPTAKQNDNYLADVCGLLQSNKLKRVHAISFEKIVESLVFFFFYNSKEDNNK